MDVSLWEFVTILVMTFGLCLFIVGIFTAYFGSGKSRKIGAGLLVGGVLIGLLWTLMTTDLLLDEPMLEYFSEQGVWLTNIVVQATP